MLGMAHHCPSSGPDDCSSPTLSLQHPSRRGQGRCWKKEASHKCAKLDARARRAAQMAPPSIRAASAAGTSASAAPGAAWATWHNRGPRRISASRSAGATLVVAGRPHGQPPHASSSSAAQVVSHMPRGKRNAKETGQNTCSPPACHGAIQRLRSKIPKTSNELNGVNAAVHGIVPGAGVDLSPGADDGATSHQHRRSRELEGHN